MKKSIISCTLTAFIFAFTTASFADAPLSNPANAFQSVSEPAHIGIDRQHIAKPDSSWGDVKKPFPTSAWFGNFALRGGDAKYPEREVGLQPLFPTPYTMKNLGKSLGFGVPDASFAREEKSNRIFAQIYAVTTQMQFGAKESGEVKRSITQANDLSATLRYTFANAGTLSFPIVRGAPYVTAYYQNLTPLLLPLTGVKSINGQPQGNPITGTRFEMVIHQVEGNTQTWVFYSEKPITLVWDSAHAGFTTTTAYTGWLRAALVEDTKLKLHNDAALFDQYAHTIPTSGHVEFSFGKNESVMRFVWKTENGQAPLMMALPHQRQLLDKQTQTTNKISYRVTQGEMRAVPGKSVWEMHLPVPKISFLELTNSHAAALPSDRKQAIIAALKIDSTNVAADVAKPDGPYGSGKRFARAARLALIANQFSQADKDLITLRAQTLTGIRTSLTKWVKGENQFNVKENGKDVSYANPLVYDTTWGGIIPSFDDFGSQIFNDHHFHYGYFVYTFAVLTELGKHDADTALWLNSPITTSAGSTVTPAQWIHFLIRDYANMSHNDDYFPFARHADFFNGHSYASGLSAAADGRNQESVSEAVNAYYAIALLGESQRDDKLKEWGELLMAQEVQAAHTYWQVTKNSDVYAPEYIQANHIATIVFDGKVDEHTYFGPEKDRIYGIEMMPFNGFAAALINKSWAKEIYELISTLNLPDTNTWKWILLKGRYFGAPSAENAKTIWTEALQSPSGNYDNGDSKTNTLYLLNTH